MPTTLTITFSLQHCHAIVSEENADVMIEKVASSIPYDFADNKALSKVVVELKSLYSKATQVFIHIPSEHSITRELTIDNNLSDSEIMQFLQARSTQLFGHPADTLCMDYEIQAATEDNKQKIVVVAAHRSLITRIQQSFFDAKIPVHCITTDDNINLLPWRDTEKRQFKKRVCFRFMIYVILILLLFIFLKNKIVKDTQTIKMRTHVIEKNNQKIIVNHTKAHLALLQKLKSMHAEKSASLTTNQHDEKLLLTIANALPVTMTLTTLNLADQTIQITGVGNSLSDIHQYVGALQEKLKNQKVTLSEIHNDQKNKVVMDFTVEVCV